MPVLGIPKHQDAAVWMPGFGRGAFDRGKAPQRPAIVGYFPVGSEEMWIVVARIQNGEHIFSSPGISSASAMPAPRAYKSPPAWCRFLRPNRIGLRPNRGAPAGIADRTPRHRRLDGDRRSGR